jgi:hydroxymethylpyrimidine pyrophosphatase-like HAD family hydrolase
MRIETYEQETGKLLEKKELDYSKGEWITYNEKGETIKSELMNKDEIEQFNEEQRKNRENNFKEESDVLFLKYQAGEIKKEDWLVKRNEIRKRYPYIRK